MKKNLTEAGKRFLAFLCVLAMLITLVPYEAYTVYAEENGKEASPKTEAESAPVVEPKVIAPEVIAPAPPKAEQPAPAPAETQKPAEAPKPTEAAKSAETPKPTEVPKPTGAPKAEETKPTEAPKDASKDETAQPAADAAKETAPASDAKKETAAAAAPTTAAPTPAAKAEEKDKAGSDAAKSDKKTVKKEAKKAENDVNITITFMNGSDSAGTATITDSDHATFAEITQPELGEKEGHSFVGWSLVEGGTDPVPNDHRFEADKNLYAIWKAESYKVTYDSQGGEAVSEAAVEYGKPVSLPKITKDHAEFQGWLYEGAVVDSLPMPAKPITLTASWKNAYIVTYRKESGGDVITTQNVTYDSEGAAVTVSRPADLQDPTKAGYNFAKWSYGSGDEFKFGETTISGDTDVYGTYTAKSYTVSFDANGGTGTAPDVNVTYDAPWDFEEQSKLFEREGYTFDGWKWNDTAIESKGEKWNIDTSDAIILKAQWKAIKYTVVFNGNGNTSGEMSEQELTYDEEAALTSNAFGKYGKEYEFFGWNTEENGGGKWYKDGQAVKNLCKEEGEKFNLYAQWYDIGKPTITNASSTPVSMGMHSISYTFTVKDGEGGTGVDPNSIAYIISMSDLDEGALAGRTDWTPVGVDNYNAADGSATFTVYAPRKGIVYVKAADKAVKPDKTSIESPDDVISFIPNGNVSYDKQRALVVENIAPSVSCTADNSDAEKNHTISYSVDDAVNEGDESSGIKEIILHLKKDGQDAISPVYLKKGDNPPKNLHEIDEIIKISGDYTFDENAARNLNGEYDLTVTATDYCGNTSTSDVVKLVFDNTAPVVHMEMLQTPTTKEDGLSYFRKDNASLKITITEDFGKVDESFSVKAGSIEKGSADFEKADDGKSYSLTFDAAENEDGLVNITVSGLKDTAGNASSGDDLTVNDRLKKGNGDSLAASFHLDKTAPRLTKVETADPGNPYTENGGTVYYYNKDVTVAFTVEEENLLDLKYAYDGSNGAESKDWTDGTEVKLSAEGLYRNIRLRGCDKAGNPLVTDLPGEGENGVKSSSEVFDEASGGKRGTAALVCNKIIDRTPPKAVITYPSGSFLYGSGDKNAGEVGAAYYNKNIGVTIAFSDTYAETASTSLDPAKVFAGRNGSASAIPGSGTYSNTISADGVYYYTAYGTDRAGNPLTVVEKAPADASDMDEVNPEKKYTTEKCESAYTAKFKLVRDTVAPQFTLSFPAVNASKNETVDGTTAYYSSAKTAAFSVTETNFDKNRIGADSITDTKDQLYSNVTLSYKNPEGGANSKGSGNYSVGMGTDGVYAFAISGEDKAGNKLVQSGTEKGKSGYQATVSAGAGKWWTHYKVLDTKKPTATLTVDDFYKVVMSASGNAPNSSDYPYQKKKSAKVTIKGKDNSPINIIYDIDSKVNSNDAEYRDSKYANNRTVSNTMKGEQEFFIKNVRIMDRAGNKISLNKTSHIYLDVTPPTNQIDKPQATIKATTAVTRRSADGRDLFNKAVTLKLTVKDPNPKTKSAGLQDVFYTVKVDGKTLTNANPVHNTGNEAAKTVGGNTELTYEWTYNLTIPASAAYESNNIEVELWAKDKAGNESNKQLGGIYKFGIDTIGPQITVTYDNNSAQNGKYFKANRTATVTVIDRNVDDGKIRITTQVPVPSGYSYTAGGNVNGNSDIWKKTLSYASDGNYTLNISGTDALGNPATVKYEGTAPQDFIVDKTAPVIEITFDNNDVRNEKYYKADRTATVTIREHNFDGKASADVTASNERDPQPDVPGMSGFSSSGDTRTATIDFTEEGKYTITVNYTDMAGNQAQTVTVGEFVIDKTAPTLEVMDKSIENKAYNGELRPRFNVDDTYYDPNQVTYKLTGRRKSDGTKISISIPQDPFGGIITLSDFLMIKDFDDIYDLTLTAVDMAGNSTSRNVKFSVNRFGSNFYYGDEASKKLSTEQYYTNSPDDYVIGEQNVNEVLSRTITVFRDSQGTELKEGTDYTVTEKEGAIGHEYLYTLKASLFEAEGNYSIVVQSKDEAGNTNTNSSVKDEKETKAVPFEFAVDVTQPTNVMTGADASKKRFQASELPVEIDFSDNMAISKIEVLYGIVKDGADIVDEPDYPIVLEGEELRKYLEENGPKVNVVFKDRGSETQFVVARTFDAAGNQSNEYRWEAVVSASRMALFFANKPLFYGSIGGGIGILALILALIAARKKKNEKEAA